MSGGRRSKTVGGGGAEGSRGAGAATDGGGREEEKEKLKHEKRKATRKEGMGESERIDILPLVEKKTRKRMATEQLTGPHKKARRATGPIKMHNMGPDG